MKKDSLEKHDMRSVRTKKAIADAMFNLLEKSPFEKIRIMDICNTAQISRTSFYLYFNDKYDLIVYCIEDIINYPNDDFEKYSDLDAYYNHLFDALYEKRFVLQTLFNYEDNMEIFNRLSMIFAKFYLVFYQQKQKQGVKFKFPVEMVAMFHSSGVCGLIYWWIKNSFPIPKEDVKNHVINKISRSVSWD